MISKAFCPGHVTGFFEVHRTGDTLSTGSMGAGICLSLGATSELRAEQADSTRIDVTINGRSSDAQVTVGALRMVLEGRQMAVKVTTSLDLPEGQGFGMSAAGSLSASLAMCDLLGLERQRAFEAAHAAEIEYGGGLGDVSALHAGGVAVRERAGLPPVGRVVRIEERPSVVLAVVGRPLRTSDVLADEGMLSRINEHGSRMMGMLSSSPSLETLMRLSRTFATDTGLASEEVLRAMDAVEPPGMASMSMLGNSVFAVGANEPSTGSLRALGEVFVCDTDVIGPRLL